MDKILSIDIKQFNYGDETVLKNIKLSAYKGECLVFTGLSGCGKTTLLRLLNRLIPDIYEGELTGSIEILGSSIESYKSGELARYVGNVCQNINEQFFSNNLEDEIALVGENLGMEQKLLYKKVNAAIKKFSLLKLKNMPIRKLSGGQKQKIAVASTLIYDTDIIIFDEPSASLDYKSTEALKETLKYLKSLNKTIIIAEHRLYYLRDILDRLIVIKEGTVRAVYSSKELTKQIQLENHLRSFTEYDLDCEALDYKNEVKAEVKNLIIQNKDYKLLYPVSFTLSQNECMAVAAPNGMGKTTLARQLTGLFDIKEGSTDFGKNKKERIKNTSISMQNCADMFFFENVEKELITKESANNKAYLAEVKKYLIEFDLWDKRYLHPHELSGGEKQRLSIILAMLKKSKLLILDEPTAGLDYKRMNIVAKAIKEKINEIPVVLITHDLELLFKVCNTALLLSYDKSLKIKVEGNENKIIDFFKCV